MATEKKSFWSSFEATDRESCAKVIRNGGIAALISAGITAVFGVIGLFVQSKVDELNYFLDPLILFDVLLIVVLAIFIFRKSRVAATAMLIYFIASKAVMFMDLGAAAAKPSTLILSVLFFLYYLGAMRATYIWHSKYRDSSDQATESGVESR